MSKWHVDGSQKLEANVVPVRKPPQSMTCRKLGEPNHMGWSLMMKPAELYACLYAKEFPAQALLRLRPVLHSKPCVVMEGEAAFTTGLLAQHKGTAARHRTQGMTRVEVDTFPEPVVLSALT